MLCRIFKWDASAWVEVFSAPSALEAATAFAQATGCTMYGESIAFVIEHGGAVERTDSDGVLGRVCSDRSPLAPNTAAAQ